MRVDQPPLTAMEPRRSFRTPAMFVALLLLLTNMSAAFAALTIRPVTWNVIGLDSNNVKVGPNVFPVGARVCNDTAVPDNTGVKAKFNFVTTAGEINLTSAQVVTIPLVPANGCADAYFEITIDRTPTAYTKRAQYNIQLLDAGNSQIAVTPANRELYVEKLISQNRNAILKYNYNGVDLPNNGSAEVVITTGQTFELTLYAKTATQGYEQLEKFITMNPNMFRVNSLYSTYTANSGTDPEADSKLYADGCGWVNDITSPNYFAKSSSTPCTTTGKYGGNITLHYNLTVVGTGNTGDTIKANALIYDFSGSSFHYNGDYDSGGLTFKFGTPPAPTSADIGIVKTAGAVSGGGAATFTLSASNHGPADAADVVVNDLVPNGYTVDNNQDTPSQGTLTVGAVNPDGTRPVTWTIGALVNGATVSATIKVNKKNTGNWLNTAIISSSTFDPNPENNESSDVASNAIADLKISKVANDGNAGVIKVGDTVTFTLKVVNLGPDAAPSTVVNDAIPAGFTYNPATDISTTPGTTWDDATKTWTIGTLDPIGIDPDGVTMTITTTVNATGPWLNTATVAADADDNDMTNNEASADATPSLLDISKSLTTPPSGDGRTGVYTLQVTKGGSTADLGTLTVDEEAPYGMIVTGITGPSQWTCVTTPSIRCTTAGDPLNGNTGSYDPILVNVSIASNVGPTLTNFASVSAANSPNSYAEAEADITVTTPPPLAVSNSVIGNFNTPVSLPASSNDVAGPGTTLVLNSIDLDPTTPGQQTTFTLPGQGTFVANSDGTVTFTPVTGFFGTVTIPYTIKATDGAATPTLYESNIANLTVEIKTSALSTTPTANNNSATTVIGVPVTLNPLNNDAPGTGKTLDPTTVKLCNVAPSAETPPNCTLTTLTTAQGTWTVNTTTGAVTFEPVDGFSGPVTPVKYQVTESGGTPGTASADINITVTGGANPAAIDDAGSTKPLTPVTLAVLTNDTPSQSAAFDVSTLKLCGIDPVQTPPSCDKTTVTDLTKGTWVVNTANGTVTFTPIAGFTGTADIPYQVTDTSTVPKTTNAVMRVDVNPASMSASNDSATTPWDTPVTLNPASNDTASPGAVVDPSTIKLCGISPAETPPLCTKTSLAVTGEGTWTVNADGTVTFDPESTFTGTTATKPTYQIYDSLGNLGTATLEVTVGAPNISGSVFRDNGDNGGCTPLTTGVKEDGLQDGCEPLANIAALDGLVVVILDNTGKVVKLADVCLSGSATCTPGTWQAGLEPGTYTTYVSTAASAPAVDSTPASPTATLPAAWSFTKTNLNGGSVDATLGTGLRSGVVVGGATAPIVNFGVLRNSCGAG